MSNRIRIDMRIELGNDAMQTESDLIDRLKIWLYDCDKVGKLLDRDIRDSNGNTVGEIEVNSYN